MGGDHLEEALGVGGHTWGAGDGTGVGEGLHSPAGADRIAGGGGEPGQGEGACLQRGDFSVGEG